MTGGLIAKTVRESWVVTLLFALALAAVEALLAYIIPTFAEELVGQFLNTKFMQGTFKALMGAEVGSTISPAIITSTMWVHPIVLALVWAHAIIFCTRLPAGEVDRGTIDVLLGLPVSRIRVYLCESVVWLSSGLVVFAMGLLGNLLGGWASSSGSCAAPGQTIAIVVNLYCLYVAVGAVGCLVSSLSDRRGRAVGIVFGVVLASYLLNSLAQFWVPAKSVSFLSMQNYYSPLLILRDNAWPVTDMLVLTGAGVVLWLAGAMIFARRDICTV
ncbi:MAG: ABC transporter permease subunit [Phycisphaerae bacterium]